MVVGAKGGASVGELVVWIVGLFVATSVGIEGCSRLVVLLVHR